MNCWAMRTSRDDEVSRRYIRDELGAGRLRQGWGSHESQDLRVIETNWTSSVELTDDQREASRHWRMGNGAGDDYMQVNDLVVVPNMPVDGLFTICRITGEYDFSIALDHRDFGHIRPVQVVGPKGGVANTYVPHPAACRSPAGSGADGSAEGDRRTCPPASRSGNSHPGYSAPAHWPTPGSWSVSLHSPHPPAGSPGGRISGSRSSPDAEPGDG